MEQLTRQGFFPLTALCDTLLVSRAGYYAWRRETESARARQDRELMHLARADIASYIAYYNTDAATRRSTTSARPNSRPCKPCQIKRNDCLKNPKHVRVFPSQRIPP